MLLDASKLNIINLQKSVLYEFLDPEQFPYESTGLLFRGIGQKELDFIRKHNYIASKGIGNDADQESTTCFSQLFSQAEGYARTQYDLYNEPQGYVIGVEPPMTAIENELGEMEVVGNVPASLIRFVMPIDELQKAMTRADAKSVHKELPPGGQWRTMNGHHIYVLNGKVLAGAVPAVKGAKKATKAQLAEHQANIDKEAKAKKKKPAAKTTKASEPKKTKKTAKAATKGSEVQGKQTKAKSEAAKARKAIDDIANSRPKEPKKKTVKEAMAESKKATDEALKKPNKKTKAGKAATKADLDKLAEENENSKPVVKPVTKEDLDEMFDSKPAPKTKKPSSKKPKDIRTEKQAKNEVAYDVGKKIGGARKDTAKLKEAVDKLISRNSGQSLEELEAISPEVAQKYCIKKNILPPLDNEYFEQEYKAGTDINVALAKAAIYDRIIPKPKGDTPKDRAEYLNAVKSLQRVLEPIRTWDEFKEATKNLGERMRLELPKELENHASYLFYAQKQLNSPVSEYDKRAWNSRTKAYEPITEAQVMEKRKKRVEELIARGKAMQEAQKQPYSVLGDKLLNFFTDYESRNRTFDTIAKKKASWDNYTSGSMQAEKEAKKVPKGEENKKKWEKIMPSVIQRKGGRTSKVNKPEDMIKNFNFSGVEFGNWVDDSSGNFHMKKCAEAFMDLADILGIKDKDVSFNGRLSMAFGARGKGSALAHYEPASKAINITKEGGAGSLAHEWGHAMDNMMYQQSAGHTSLNLASQGMKDEGDPAVKAAYKEVMQEIMFGDGTGKGTVPNKGKPFYSIHPSFRTAVSELGLQGAIKKATQTLNDKHKIAVEYYDKTVRAKYGDATADKYLAKEERKHKLAMNDMVQEMAYHHEKLTGEHLDSIPTYTGRSQYYEDSSKMGGSGNKYWTSNDEMFARAFENYIEGKMKAGKVKNDYLVYGTYNDPTSPYPRGEERDSIHAKFDKLMDAIRKSGAIQKALEIEALEKSLENYNRNAYNVADTSEVFFIPVNRLKCEYQTEAALNFDKIRENVERMKNGENLEPVVIGYDYDVHDGHHRLEASKIMNYTHAPCVVGGSNEIDVQRAKEAYSEVWR